MFSDLPYRFIFVLICAKGYFSKLARCFLRRGHPDFTKVSVSSCLFCQAEFVLVNVEIYSNFLNTEMVQHLHSTEKIRQGSVRRTISISAPICGESLTFPELVASPSLMYYTLCQSHVHIYNVGGGSSALQWYCTQLFLYKAQCFVLPITGTSAGNIYTSTAIHWQIMTTS